MWASNFFPNNFFARNYWAKEAAVTPTGFVFPVIGCPFIHRAGP